MHTALTPMQKLEAIAFKYYQGHGWQPSTGDYYTSSRADLELYRVVSVNKDKVHTIYCNKECSVAVWDLSTFTSEGFGLNRVHVPLWILGLKI